MNMNKTTVAVIAAVAILLTVSCVGVTYSWFSNEEKTEVHIDPATMTVKAKDNKYVIWADFDPENKKEVTSSEGKITVDGILLEPGATYHVKFTVDYETNVSSASVKTEASLNEVESVIKIKYNDADMNGWKQLDSGKESFVVEVSFTIDENWTSEQSKGVNPVLTITNFITQTGAVKEA